MDEIILRDADDRDLPAALSVMQLAFAEQAALDPPSGVGSETLASLRERLGAGGVLLAEADGQVVGCVLFRPEEDHMYLGRLAVLPGWRGLGLGRRLVDAIELRAARLGFARVRLGVRLALPALLASYERRGYRTLALRHHTGYSEPTYALLEKSLPCPT